MADPVTISALPAVTTLDGNEVVALDQSGVTKKATIAQVRAHVDAFIVLLSEFGSNTPPTVTETQNDIGTISVAEPATGQYTISIPVGADANKINVLAFALSDDGGTPYLTQWFLSSTDEISVNVINLSNAFADPNQIYIKIELYS